MPAERDHHLLDVGVRAKCIARGERDRVGPAGGIGMAGVLGIAGVAVPQVPRPGLWDIGGGINEVHRTAARGDEQEVEIRGGCRCGDLAYGRKVEGLHLVAPIVTATLLGTEAQAPTGEGGPDEAAVGTAVEQFVGGQDGIPSVHKTRAAGLDTSMPR